jgi:hypothetical protein
MACAIAIILEKQIIEDDHIHTFACQNMRVLGKAHIIADANPYLAIFCVLKLCYGHDSASQ